MSQNSSTSNDNVQQQAASKRADNSSSSYNPCDNNQRNTNEQSAILNQENVTATSARLSSSEEDMQETPIDFSLPKGRRKISPHRRQTFLQQTYYVSSSPPLNMSSQRSTPDKMHEAGYNGSRSPSNLYSQHPNSNSNSELFANGHIVASRLSPEMMIRERSQSFSSVTQIRQQRHSAAHHSHTLSSNSEIGPPSTHASDPALSHNVTHPLTYAEIIPQSMAVGTNATGISSLAPDEVLNHYGFLPAGIESSFAESLGRNGLLTSSLHNKIPSGELSTTNSAKLIATIKTTSPSLTVTTSPSLTINTSPSLTVTTSTTLAVTTSTALVVTTSPSLAVTASPSLAVSAPGVTKRRRSLPDDQKDRAYWERRRKNNVAAKRSRDARRIKEEAIALRASFLEQENIKLRCEIATLKAETEKLRVLLYDN